MTPEREREISDYPVPLHIPPGWPWAQFRGELLAELDRVREELKSEKSFSSNMASDALSALSQFTCTPEKGYIAEPLALPWDIERLGRERDQLLEKIKQLEASLAIAMEDEESR